MARWWAARSPPTTWWRSSIGSGVVAAPPTSSAATLAMSGAMGPSSSGQRHSVSVAYPGPSGLRGDWSLWTPCLLILVAGGTHAVEADQWTGFRSSGPPRPVRQHRIRGQFHRPRIALAERLRGVPQPRRPGRAIRPGDLRLHRRGRGPLRKSAPGLRSPPSPRRAGIPAAGGLRQSVHPRDLSLHRDGPTVPSGEIRRN